MQRTKQIIRIEKNADAILTSDWHLREDTPTCWISDFQKEQWVAVAFIRELQVENNCPVLHAGDLFHHWKPSPWLLTQAFDLLPAEFYTIYGQHDLPQHNWELRGKSGIKTLEIAKRIKVLEGCHYGQSPENLSFGTANFTEGDVINIFSKTKRILIWHHLTYTVTPFPGAMGGMAEGILRKYPQYDLIVTGDNHQSFTVEYKGRRLVNPGNITRQTADQIDFKPRVYLWYEDDNSVVPVYLPITKDAITRQHIEIKEQRDARIDAFVSQLNGKWDVALSFEDNLKQFQEVNSVEKEVMDIIYKAIES